MVKRYTKRRRVGNIHARVEPQEHRQLFALAKQLGVSRSELIRRAIAAYTLQPGPAPVVDRPDAPPVS